MKYRFILLAMMLFCASTGGRMWAHDADNDARKNSEQEIAAILSDISVNNLRLQALRHDNAAALLDLKSENVLSAPSIEYTPQYQKGVRKVATAELIISQEFEVPTQYSMRRQRARIEGDVLDLQYEAEERNILLEARLLCLDVIRLNQLRGMLARRMADSEQMLSLYEKRLAAGDVNILEVNKVKLERMDVMKLSAQVDNERIALLEQLEVLNGGKTVEVSSDRFPECQLPLNFDDFLSQSLAQNADVRVAEASLKAAVHDVKASRQAWLPTLSVGYRRNTDPDYHQDGFTVGAAFPLMSTTSKVRAAKQRQQSAQLQLQDTQLKSSALLRSQYKELCRLRSELDHTDIELLTSTLDILSKALQHGEVTAIEYYSQTADVYNKLQAHVEVHCQYVKLYAELMKTLPRPLP